MRQISFIVLFVIVDFTYHLLYHNTRLLVFGSGLLVYASFDAAGGVYWYADKTFGCGLIHELLLNLGKSPNFKLQYRLTLQSTVSVH